MADQGSIANLRGETVDRRLLTAASVSGTNDAGTVTPLAVTAEGHLEVAIHGPRHPFGSVAVESLTPVVQNDSVYGLNAIEQVTTVSGTGQVTAGSNLFTVATGGTTAGALAALQSRRRLRYRPGQGIVGRCTAVFGTGKANVVQVAGFGSAEAGIYVGYNGTSFGILHSTGGVREIHTFTVTTASTATNNYVVTLPNASTVNVTATSNSSTVKTAYEIAQGTFPGWDAEAKGSTVLFVRGAAGPSGGSFSLAQTGAGTPAAGSDVTTLTGVAATDSWVPQASWNGDPFDGTGPSGVTLDPTKGNVYEIGIQYLGFGAVTVKIEAALTGNNPDFVVAHTFPFQNARTAVTLSQPAFPFTASAVNTGTAASTTSLSIGSYAGFVEGQKKSVGPRLTYGLTLSATSSTSAYVPLYTVRNSRTFGGRANQTVINLISLAAAAKSNTGLTTVLIIRNATLTGTPNFAAFATGSCTTYDTAATGCSFSDNNQVIFATTLSEADSSFTAFADEITVQPGESITVACRSVTATATVVAELNTREDQ